ncbi:hypothetical protein SAMN02910409_0914 [Prevotellaceae bacterium HUN156]|nr:hypothetical protein SAMN02910409_0914 [Prevotellaceae bacterium HUN156]
MKKLYYLFFLAVIAAFAACGGDDATEAEGNGGNGGNGGSGNPPTGITMERLAGSWQAIHAKGTASDKGYEYDIDTKELTGLDSLDAPVLIILQPNGNYNSYNPEFTDYAYLNGIRVPSAHRWRSKGIYNTSGVGKALLVGRQLQLTDNDGDRYSILLEIVSLTDRQLVIKYNEEGFGSITVTYGRDGEGADYYKYTYINHNPQMTGRWRMTGCSENGAPIGFDYYFNADGTGYSSGNQMAFTFQHDYTGYFTLTFNNGYSASGYISIYGNKPGAYAEATYRWSDGYNSHYMTFEKISDETH